MRAALYSGPVSAWEAVGRMRRDPVLVSLRGGEMVGVLWGVVTPGWAEAVGSARRHRRTQPPHSCAAGVPGGLESDVSKVRYKLRKFLLRRPTLQSLREKGYIKGTGGVRRAGCWWPRGQAGLTSLSPRPGVRLRAGRAV